MKRESRRRRRRRVTSLNVRWTDRQTRHAYLLDRGAALALVNHFVLSSTIGRPGR